MKIEKLGVDSGLEWSKDVKVRLLKIESKLMGRTDEAASVILALIKSMRLEFLFEGYEEFFHILVPRNGNIVLGHCDT